MNKEIWKEASIDEIVENLLMLSSSNQHETERHIISLNNSLRELMCRYETEEDFRQWIYNARIIVVDNDTLEKLFRFALKEKEEKINDVI